MDDLISRRTIIKTLESKKKGFEDCASSKEVKLNKEWNKAVDECIGEIQMLSAAYNVDKVVEQLEIRKTLAKSIQEKVIDHAMFGGVKYMQPIAQTIEEDLEIVKAGGKQ